MDAAPTVRSSSLQQGTLVGRYRIAGEIGRGGMGVVYAAEDVKLHRRVALKFLPPHLADRPDARRRFDREVRAASALNHPNICTIYDIDEADGRPFIAMELLDGETLEAKTTVSALDIEQVVEIGIQIADALDAAHKAGIVHRDIKSANVFVTRGGQAKVLDFGLAKIVPEPAATGSEETRSELTKPGATVGTVAYMSPEQVRGRAVDARTDLFSFGVVLYRMVTGVLPFRGASTGDLFDAVLHATPPSPSRLNPAVPQELERIISKALEKDPDLRYQHAAEIRADLKRARRETASARSVPVLAPAAPRRRGVARAWRTAIALPVVAVAAIGILIYSRRAPALGEKDTIVLADFDNRTGDAVFDDTLKEALATDLQQSPFVNILSDQRARAMLRLMGRAPGTPLNADVARDLCQRVGSKAVLAGSIAPLGTHYVIGLNAMNCATGDSIGREEREASRKEEVLKALDQAAVKLRERLGESLASIQKFDTPIEEATTSSLEALRAYSAGVRARWERTDAQAIPLLQRATELDPGFAWAYLHLAVSYWNLGEPDVAARYATTAYALRNRVSEHERCTISAQYHEFVTGDLDRELAAWEACGRTYPRDFVPPLALGIIYSKMGQFDRSVASTREALRLEPTNGNCYANLMYGLCVLGRIKDATELYREAVERKVDNAPVHLQRYEIAFLEGDTAEMQRQVAWAAGKPGVEGILLILESATAAASGRVALARDWARQAVDSAIRAGEKETAGWWQAMVGSREAESGNRAEARKDARAALALSPTRDVQIAAALALARSGQAAEAGSLADRLAAAHPTDTILNSYWLPAIRAAIALDRKEPARAIEILQAAQPYDLAAPPPYIGALYPVYLRGTSYLLLRQGDRAAVEFRKVLDHPGLVINSALGPLSRLGFARACSIQGDTDRARSAYEQFLALWRDADGNLPVLQQARTEHAKIASSR